jgi:tRNA(Phe) wybutosine-synthesizing methylase Tyw3
MIKKTCDTGVFSKEFKALEYYRQKLFLKNLSKDQLYEEMDMLLSNYAALLDDVVKITQIGDKSLKKLMKAKEKIEQLNERLQESERNVKELNTILMFYINATEKDS